MVWVTFLRDYEKHKSGETIDVGRYGHACALVQGNIARWATIGSGGATIITTIDGDDYLQVIDNTTGDEAYVTVNNFNSTGGGGHTGTTGSVFFAGAGGAGSDPTEDNSNLFWNDTDDRLGVGVNSSLLARVHIEGDLTGTDLLRAVRSGVASTADYIYFGDGTAAADFIVTGDGRVGINIDEATINAQLRVETSDGGPALAAAFIVDNNETDSTAGIQLFHDGTGDGMDIVANSVTTGVGLDMACNGLTTGEVARFASNSDSAANRELVYIHNDHASATGAVCLYVLNDSTGPLIEARDGLTADDVRFGVHATGHIVCRPDQTTDTAPIDDTSVKKWSIQRLAADPTNAAFIKFSNSPGTPGNDFYLVLEEET